MPDSRLRLVRWPLAALALLLAALLLIAPTALRADDGDNGDPAAAPPAPPSPPAGDTRSAWDRLADPRWRVRTAAYRELAAIEKEQLLPLVREHLDDTSARVRKASVLLLGRFDRAEDVLELLVSRLDDASRDVAREARVGLLRRFRPGITATLQTLADQQREEWGIAGEGLDRLIYVFRLREVLTLFEKWRTHRNPTGIRVPGQYAGVFDSRPDAIDVLLRFLADDKMTAEEIGDTWSVGEALVASVRALSDNNVADARPALLQLLRRSGLYGNRFYIRRQAVFGGEGDISAIQQVTALALHKLGTDMYVEDQLQRYEQNLRDYPNAWMAFMVACIYMELGDNDRAMWALRIGVSKDQNGFAFGGNNTPISLGHLHLAAMILDRATNGGGTDTGSNGNGGKPADAKNGAGQGGDDEAVPGSDEPMTVDVALEHIKQALELGFDDPEWLQIDPRFDAIRDRDDFKRYLTNLARIYPPPADDDEKGDDDDNRDD
ncbi:MAG: HEAT repeat domain-containing protein [Planctomycetota bacterium]